LSKPISEVFSRIRDVDGTGRNDWQLWRRPREVQRGPEGKKALPSVKVPESPAPLTAAVALTSKVPLQVPPQGGHPPRCSAAS
jgi:hypothetical protein